MTAAVTAPAALTDEEHPDDAGDDDAAAAPQPFFFRAPLSAPGPEWCELTLEQLADFFRNPSRYLLRRRMDIALSYQPDELLDQEPFTLDARGRRVIAARLLPRLVENPADPAALELLAAGTELPDGNMGEFERHSELASLREFAARVHDRTRAPILAPRHTSIALDMGEERWRLAAAVSDLRANGLVRWRYSMERDIDALPAAEALTTWLSHLVLCADPPPGVSLCTTAIARNGTWVFRPPADPRAILTELLAVYRQGLVEPVHFFPRSAWKYCHGGHRFSKARAQWRANDHKTFAESDDAAYALAFRGQPEPLDSEFHRLASLVFDPLIAHVDKEGSGP
jgi:exodeoxyribonuclease V gamma subunit